MDVQQTIRAVREKEGLTQQQLADKLFVTRQAVSRRERGRTMPDLDTLKKLAQLFGVDARTLLGLDAGAVCQSCGTALRTWDDLGTDAHGAPDLAFCAYCMRQGAFGPETTLEQMVESNLASLDRFNKENGTNYTVDEARAILLEYLGTLKRWRK